MRCQPSLLELNSLYWLRYFQRYNQYQRIKTVFWFEDINLRRMQKLE